ncbi:MAG TPA: SBBP repeat-containing protein [Terriglobales bacterium]|nr:SBBP repeat-containing protein [Terriglobales bacterium]
MARVKVLLAVTLLAGGALTLSLLSPKPATGNLAQATSPVSPLLQHSNPGQTRVAYGQLPMAFEPNMGQTDSRVKFMARGSKYGLFLTGHEAVLSLAHASSPLQMSLAGSNSNAEVSGTDALPGKSNYLIGKDPSRWHTNVPQFARVRYSQVYPGVDLVYYGKQGELEYDFQIAPGADPKQVALQFAGTDHLRLDSNGDLLLAANGGEMRLHAPVVYQAVAGEKKAVEGKFVLLAQQQVGFEIGTYDRNRELVIDPVLSYSTYLGGSGAEDAPISIAADNALNTYIAGSTTSGDFPILVASDTVPSAFQSCLNKPDQPQPASPCAVGTTDDAFIAKLNPAGTAIVFATYLGGSGTDIANSIAIDSGFNVVIAGKTNSTDFPVTNSFQTTLGPAGFHAFVSKVDPAGHALQYSTYLGGSETDTAMGVAVDFRGKIYVIGNTTSTDFPTTADAFQTTSKAENQVFVSKIDPATTSTQSLIYSTYFGGGDPANGTISGNGIAVDRNNGVYITGSTNFQHTGANATLDFPILNAPQSCLNDPTNDSPCMPPGTNRDAFVAKLNPTNPIGSHLVYSTYVGGSNVDDAFAIAVDSGGFAYITGQTNSADIPLPGATSTTTTTIVPFQQCLSAGTATNPASPTKCTTTGTDAFLAKLSAFTSGTTTAPTVAVTYFSYLGGTGIDAGNAIAVDGSGGAYITGTTTGNFPVVHAPATPASAATFNGGSKDAFVARIDTTATSQTASTHFSFYLGGSGDDIGSGIAVDPSGGIYVAGSTTSGNFPTTAGVLKTNITGSSDAFVTKIGPAINLSMAAAVTPTTPIGVGGQATFTYTITNAGDFVPGAVVVVNLPNTDTATVVSISGTGCPATPTPPTATCSLGPIASTTTTTTSPQITVVLAPRSQEPPASTTLSNSAVMVSPVSLSKSASISVNDYRLSLNPNSATVKAGSAATYTAQVSPTGAGFPGSVSISCSGLPTGVSCSVANGSITNLNTGPQTRAVVVNTTARVTTTAELRKHGLVYAVWFPVSGLAFLGLGVGSTMTRKRRAALGLLIGTFFVLVFLQAGCGSSSSGTTTTTGTTAGKYTFNITASSGTGASHSQSAELEVQ